MSEFDWVWTVIALLFGLCVGSFLNVVIYRLPIADKDLNLSKPTWSFCPNCRETLTAVDLVPLFSFLLLGRKCRRCKKPISWRYFGVELLTGLLFAALYVYARAVPANAIALIAFAAVLIPIFFIDLERFEIPLSLTLLATLIPVLRDVWGIVQHEPNHALIWGWLPRSLLGAAVGMLIFGIMRVAGWMWKGVEAMGLGDVLLARGMGAMLIALVPAGEHPLLLFPVWLLLSCLSGIIVGFPLIWRRNSLLAQQEKAEAGANSPPDEEEFVREGTLGQQLVDIGWCFWFGDLIEYFRATFLPQDPNSIPEPDDWEPHPTAIPFGPFLVIGFLATVFVGHWLTMSYLNYALPPVK